jgi:cellulose synthase/poly-beta-1,6-N-acetylglucosamine synthase-like glycosyltransferase
MTIAIIIFSVVLCINLCLLLLFRLNFKTYNQDLEAFSWPSISILIAARNEEQHLKNCVDAILNLDYPKEKVQILIGNDASEDATQSIIDLLREQDSRIQSVIIEQGYKGLVAKSNVVAQLAKKAEGELLVFVDADITVTPNWLKEMVYPVTKGADLVSGYTAVFSPNGFASLQAVDWKGSIFLVKVMADLGFPVTALGNNMLIRKSAYLSIGGFESVGRTKVEDLKISKALRKAGFKVVQIVEASAQVFTQPMHTLPTLFSQRRRWLSGILQYRLVLGLILSVERLCLPILLILLIFADAAYAGQLIGLFVFFLATEKAKTTLMDMKLGSGNKRSFFFEPIFISLLNTFALLSLIVVPKVTWKNRRN